jgi:hypothetical protein
VLDSKGTVTPRQAWSHYDCPGTLDNIQCRVRRALKAEVEVSRLKALLLAAERKRKAPVLCLGPGKENNNNNNNNKSSNFPSFGSSSSSSSSSSSTTTATPSQPRRVVTKKTRSTTHQVDVALYNAHALKTEYSRALKSATIDYAAFLKKDAGDRSNGGAEGIAKRINLTLAEGVKHLTGRIIRSSVQLGRIGMSPRKRGREPMLPAILFEAASCFIQMKQLSGDEQKPRQIKNTLRAAVVGTPYEKHLNTMHKAKHALKRLRCDHAPEISSLSKCTVDDRRWLWMTFPNLDRWFDGWAEYLVARGFASWRPEGTRVAADDDGVGELYISPQMRHRIINCDETHHKMTSEGDNGGSRSHTYGNKSLGCASSPFFTCIAY